MADQLNQPGRRKGWIIWVEGFFKFVQKFHDT